MFTGLIEEIGQVSQVAAIAGGKRITIAARKVLTDLAVDHSVSISGVCLTVVNITKDALVVEAVGETLNKSTIGRLRTHDFVNLERAMQMGERLGGHLVQGHINGIGTLVRKDKRGKNWYIEVEIPHAFERYLISEGSIAIDGISLTIAVLHGNRPGFSIIPHTYNHTTVQYYKIGHKVNVEVDFIARHIEKLTQSKEHISLTFEKIKDLGY
jgi:riboflavin synthase